MENGTQPQEQNITNWFDRHKVITGFSIFALSVLLFSIFHHSSGNNVATLGAQTVKNTPASITASPTLLPTDTIAPTDEPTNTPLPTVFPTRVPIKAKVIYAAPTAAILYTPPTATPIPANPQTQTQQSTQQQQCAGATALCNDGTCSYSAHHQGTCSHHGGVVQWYN